jgi:hypothetical protein
VSFAVFSGVLQAEFLMWDDDIAILENVNLVNSNLWQVFGDLDTTQRYNPLIFILWRIIYIFSGFNPFWFHFASVLYHSLSALLLYFSLREILQLLVQKGHLYDGNKFSREIAAVAGALIWSLHPLRVEVVALAATATYCQAVFFLMVSLFCYLKAYGVESRPSMRRVLTGASLFSYACSLLTYPLGITFFLIFPVIDLMLLKRIDLSGTNNRWERVKLVALEKGMFALPAFIIALVAVLTRHRPSAIWEYPVSMVDFGVLDRIMQAFYIWGYYIWKPFYPVNLSPLYMTLTSFEPLTLPFICSLLAILGITLLCLYLRKSFPFLIGLWLCYLVLLIPFLGIFEHPHFHSDRYSILSSLILSILGAVLVFRLIPVVQTWRLAICLTVLLMTLGLMSRAQVGVWRNSEVLFNYIYHSLGENPYRLEILGRLVRYYKKIGDMDQVVQTLQRILAVKPQSVKAHRELAEVYMDAGRFDEALQHFERILEKEPSNIATKYDFAIALLKAGRKDEAARQFQNLEVMTPR